jgi:hypothetical protein
LGSVLERVLSMGEVYTETPGILAVETAATRGTMSAFADSF